MPVVSVIMPLYNAERYLREALNSIMRQTFTDWELLAVNEPDSTDKTAEIVREYAKKDARFILIQNETKLGISESLNVGLRLARGEFIARMDADDISLPERFERQVAFMRENPDIDILGIKPHMLGASWDWHIETDSDYLKSDCLFYTPFVHPTIMMRAERLREFNLAYNRDFHYTEDYEFFSRASMYLKFTNILQPLFEYRWHEENATLAGGDYGIKLYRDVTYGMLRNAGVSLSDEEADFLCVHTCREPKTGQDALDIFFHLDLLLKRIYFCDAARKIYGVSALYHTMWRRWNDAFEHMRYKTNVMSDTRVEPAYRRGFFYRNEPYSVNSDLVLNDMPKVSILLPALNSEAYIADTLRSLFEQTFTDFEVLLINDVGSNDNTLKIAKSFNDPRLRIIEKNKNPGLADSLNLGIRESKGIYIARADADDLYPADRLQKQVRFMDENPTIAVCGSWQHHFGKYDSFHKPPETHEELKASLIFKCDICHSTLMLRKSEFIDNDLWYDNNFMSEDYELWTRAIYKIKFHTLQEVLGEYRVWGGGVTDGKANVLDIEARKIVARTLKEHLNIIVPEKKLILLSGWINPFLDATGAEKKKLLRNEEALLNKIRKQNEILKIYEPSALESALTKRELWMQYGDYDTMNQSGLKTHIKNFVKRMLSPFYKVVRRFFIDLIIKRLDELKWNIDTRIWKSEELIMKTVKQQITQSEMCMIKAIKDELASYKEKQTESLKYEVDRILSTFDGRIWEAECRREKMFSEYKLQTEAFQRCRYLLINDTFNTFHHGSTATSIAIKSYLGDSVNTIPYDLIFNPRVFPTSLREFLSREFEIKWEKENNWLIEKVKQCEEVVMNGEGSMACYGNGTLYDLYLAYYCSVKLGKKVHIINHSIYTDDYVHFLSPDAAEDFKAMVRLTYSVITNAYIREPQSFMHMEKLLPGKAKQSFDCISLYISKIYDRSRTDNVKKNGIVISGGNFLGPWYADFLKALLKTLPAKFSDMSVSFLFSDIPYCELSGDEELFSKISAVLGGNVEKCIVKSTDEWLDVIGSTALFISGRFHHSIAAFMLDTPFFAFKTDTKKMEGMLEVIQKTENLLSENKDQALLQCKTLFENPKFFENNDNSIKEKIVDMALRNFTFD